MDKNITIHMGAAAYSMTVGDLTVDLSSVGKNGRYEARRTLIEHLKRDGYFGKKEQRKAFFRDRRATRS